MNRIIIFVFLLVSVATSAQDFHGGLVLGVAGSQIDGDNHRGYFKGGLNLGAFVNRQINKRSGWQMEIKYTGKGARSLDSSSTSTNYYHVSLKYVELPILYYYQINQKYSIQVGASVGYLFKGYYTGFSIASDPSLSTYINEDITASLSKFDFDALIGFSYHLTKSLEFNLRLSRSVSPVYHVSGGTATRAWYRNTYNNTLAFALYYTLGNK